MRFFEYKKILLVVALFLLFGASAKAASLGEIVTFNVDKNFDSIGRTQLQAILVKSTNNLYFYIEKAWWDEQLVQKQSEVLANLDILSLEFDNKIYPTLTSIFGIEQKPGIDGDNKITVLLESMNSTEGGYFREADGYVKLQVPTSNEREMVYLSLNKISDTAIKGVLAHEFVHLITFNQKNKIFSIEEDIWLNEARADYSSTILGYNDVYQGSNLQQRVNDFVENPSDSVTEWLGTKYDYASTSVFTHYLVDYYGINILADSLKSNYVGIDSINYALQKMRSPDNFSKIFTNWTIASLLNNCSINLKYCYANQNLKNLRIVPSLNFLPLTGNVSLSVANITKSWTGNWLKFIGGNGNLRFNFSSLSGLTFQVPYLIQDSAGNFIVKFITLDKENKGQIDVEKFGSDYKALIIIPSLQSDIYKTEDVAPTYPFTYTVAITGSTQNSDQELIQQLLSRIAELKKEIARLQALRDGQATQICGQLNSNLYFGLASNDVKCLQQFLASQGQGIYPEGYVTGNFGNMTKNAVIKFQAKYSIPQTGYVGPITREKINQLLSRI